MTFYKCLTLNNRVILLFNIVETPVSLISEDVIEAKRHMIRLKKPENIPADVLTPMVVKQGTEEWHALRKQAVFTGSTLYTGLGLFKLCDQISFFKDHLGPDQHHEPTGNSNQATDENVLNDCVDDRQTDVKNDSPNEQEEAKQGVTKEQYMNWGRENEKHAAATVLSYALPLYFPGTIFVEAGASFIKCEQTHENLVEVSTDGLICSKNSVTGEMEVIAKTEFKCPYPPIEGTYKLPVYYELPKHYALQVLVEMEAEPSVPQLIFACYSKQSTVISRVTFDNELWLLAKIEIKSLLEQLKQRKPPNKSSLFSRELIPRKIQEFLEKHVELLIEVPSVTDSSQYDIEETTLHCEETPYLIPKLPPEVLQPVFTIKDLSDCASQLHDAIHSGYELSRLKAKELLVCLLSSANRMYDPELPLHFPVFYGIKGKTFSNQEKRRLYDNVMDECMKHKVDVLATSFDGECFSLITEDLNGNPLTIIQLQHKVFAEVKKLDKKQIIKNIVHYSASSVSEKVMSKCNHAYLSTGKVDIGGMKLPKMPYIELRKATAENEKAAERAKSKTANRSSDNTIARRQRAAEDVTENQAESKPKSKRRKIQNTVFNPRTLGQQARSVVESSSYYKAALNVSYAKVLWPERIKQWKENSPIVHGMKGFPDTWYCIPEYCEKRKRLEHKVWDSTHIMTNMGRVVCSKGTKLLKREAWLAASQDPSNKLKHTMVLDLPDKQDIGFALTTFSKEVENSMVSKNFAEEANFCKLMRQWWEAEDEPGIPALKRHEYRLNLRNYLLQDVDFSLFPPFTEYVKGK